MHISLTFLTAALSSMVVAIPGPTSGETSTSSSACDNQGLQYAVFANPLPPNSGEMNSHYAKYKPTYMQAPNGTQYLYYNSTTANVGGFADLCDGSAPGNISIYGSSQQFDCQFFSIDHRGYLRAGAAGSYQIIISADDIAFLWSGDIAKKGWSRANADLVVYYSNHAEGTGTHTYQLTAGEYLPIRLVYGNAQGTGDLTVKIIDPAGKEYTSSEKEPNPLLVQYSCDRKTAPAFPYKFGSEQ